MSDEDNNFDSGEVQDEGQTGADDQGDKAEGSQQETVPKARFNEVYGEKKELERQIASLQKQDDKGNLTPEQQKELQAKNYLLGLVNEALDNREKNSKEAEAKELAQFNSDVSDALAQNTDVKRSDFLKFLESDGDDYSSVGAAMKGYLRIQGAKKEGSDQTKENMNRKPGLPKSEGSGGEQTGPPESDKDKSILQIASEAARGLMGKK